MKKHRSSHTHPGRKKHKKGDTDQLAAQLAPLEEQDKPAAEHQIGNQLDLTNGSTGQDAGAIIVDSKHLKISTDLVEGQNENRLLGLEPVVLVVLVIMLSFIAFIAWQISLMPAR